MCPPPVVVRLHLASIPHSNALFTPAVTAPDVARPRNREGELEESEFANVVSDALRRAITAKFFATLGADGELRGDLQAVCREAKRHDLRVEHLIIAFKEAWHALPEARMLPQGSQGPEFLSRIITLCIAEFYSPRTD